MWLICEDRGSDPGRDSESDSGSEERGDCQVACNTSLRDRELPVFTKFSFSCLFKEAPGGPGEFKLWKELQGSPGEMKRHGSSDVFLLL